MGVRALIVLDTHVWIWWQAAPSRLSRSAARLIADSGEIGVSAASCYELARLVARKRLKLDRPAGEWIRRALAEDRVHELPVSARIASTAGEIDDRFPGDPLDRLIYATALEHRARLVTRDRRLRTADPSTAAW